MCLGENGALAPWKSGLVASDGWLCVLPIDLEKEQNKNIRFRGLAIPKHLTCSHLEREEWEKAVAVGFLEEQTLVSSPRSALALLFVVLDNTVLKLCFKDAEWGMLEFSMTRK